MKKPKQFKIEQRVLLKPSIVKFKKYHSYEVHAVAGCIRNDKYINEFLVDSIVGYGGSYKAIVKNKSSNGNYYVMISVKIGKTWLHSSEYLEPKQIEAY